MNNESCAGNINDILCECCGESAQRYEKSFPICNNPVCFEVRIDRIKDVIEMNNKSVGEINA